MTVEESRLRVEGHDTCRSVWWNMASKARSVSELMGISHKIFNTVEGNGLRSGRKVLRKALMAESMLRTCRMKRRDRVSEGGGGGGWRGWRGWRGGMGVSAYLGSGLFGLLLGLVFVLVLPHSESTQTRQL